MARCVSRVWCPVSALNPFVLHHDGVAHQTSLRSRTTMMIYPNSLHVREAGRLSILPVTKEQDHVSTQASPHTGITAPSAPSEHDGRTPRNRSDRVTRSRVGCQACAPPPRELSQAPSVAVCAGRSVPGWCRVGRHGWPLHTTENARTDSPVS